MLQQYRNIVICHISNVQNITYVLYEYIYFYIACDMYFIPIRRRKVTKGFFVTWFYEI